MGTFAEAYGSTDFSVYHGSTVPVVPQSFPNESMFPTATYAKIGRDASDLADGSTPSARDRLKEIGVNFTAGLASTVYSKIQSKITDRDVPTTGLPASKPQPPGGIVAPAQEGNLLQDTAAKAGLTGAQAIFLVVVGTLLLIGIAKG